MPDEPDDLEDAISRAEAAFSGSLGRPEYEEGLDPADHDLTHEATRQVVDIETYRD